MHGRIRITALIIAFLLVVGSFSGTFAAEQASTKNTNYFTNGEKLLNTPFTFLPLGSVKAGGWLKNQLEMQANGLTGSMETASSDIVNSAWLGKGGENWERGPYYVRGLVALAYTLEDTSLMAKVPKWIDWSINSQNATTGWFGPTAQSSDDSIWARMPMLEAIRDYCDYQYGADPAAEKSEGYNRIINFFTKYYRGIYDRAIANNGVIQGLNGWAAHREGDMMESVDWLYNRTGDSWLIDLNELIFKTAGRIQPDLPKAYYNDQYKEVGSRHIVNVHQSFKIAPLYYMQNFNSADSYIYRDSFKEGLENFQRRFGMITGMISGSENLLDIDAAHGTETCAVVEGMYSDEVGLRTLGDAWIGDHLEKITYNSLPAPFNEDLSKHQYYHLPNGVLYTYGSRGYPQDHGDDLVFGAPSGFPCCYHNLHMGWPRFVQNMWMATNDNGLAIAAYGPNEVTARVADHQNITINQTTNYPFDNYVKLTVKTDNEVNFPLKLRIPEWSKTTEIRVNGQNVSGAVPEEYFTIERSWKNGDVIELKFSDEIRLTNWQNNAVGVEKGSLVFAMKVDENWVNGREVYPDSPWNYGIILNDKDTPENSFEVVKKASLPYQPFSPDGAPIVLKAKGKQIFDWKMTGGLNNSAGTVPLSPLNVDTNEDEIELVPFGSAKLRVSVIPEIGDPKTIYRFEAESMHLLDGGAAVKEDTTASKGEYVSVASNERLMVKNVTVDKTNIYKVRIGYKSASGASGDILLNNSSPIPVNFAATSTWKTVELEEVKLYPHLYNSFDFKGISGNIDVDYVEVEYYDDGGELATVKKYEAESAALNQCNVSNSASASGGKCVAGIDAVGASITWSNVKATADGVYQLKIAYSTDMAPAKHMVSVNGVDIGEVTYANNAGWFNFNNNNVVTIQAPLKTGNNIVKVWKSNSNQSFAQVDYIEVSKKEMDEDKYEAEAGVLTACNIHSGSSSASGGGFVGEIDAAGTAGVEFRNVTVDKAGTYEMKIAYTTDMAPATHTVVVNGTTIGKVTYTVNKGWGNFYPDVYVTINVPLNSGANIVKVWKASDDTSFGQLDYISILKEKTAKPLIQYDRYEAESGTIIGNPSIGTSGSASGGKFVGGFDVEDRDGLVISNVQVDTAGEYEARIGYTKGQAPNATHTITVNGTVFGKVTYTGNQGWGNFAADRYITVKLPLVAGNNTIKIMKAAGDTNFAQLDYIEVVKPYKMKLNSATPSSGGATSSGGAVLDFTTTPGIDEYTILYGTSESNLNKSITGIKNSPFPVLGLLENQTYYFKVTGKNSEGTYESNVLSAVIPAAQPFTPAAVDGFTGDFTKWTRYGNTGSITLAADRITFASNSNVKAAQGSANWTDYVYSADITLAAANSSNNAGMIFRVTNPRSGADGYEGFYAGLQAGSGVLVGSANGSWNPIVTLPADIKVNTKYNLKVVVYKNAFEVYVENLYVGTVKSDLYPNGSIGMRSYNKAFNAENANLVPVTESDVARFEKITDLNISDFTKTSANISWNKPHIADSYMVFYGTSADNLDKFFTTNTDSDVLQDLQPGTQYFVRVVAMSDKFGVLSHKTTSFSTRPSNWAFLKSVKLTASSPTVDVDKNATTSLTVTMSDNSIGSISDAIVEYSSENNNIATIDNNGVITGKASGVTNIFVKVTKDGISRTGNLVIRVGDYFNVKFVDSQGTTSTLRDTFITANISINDAYNFDKYTAIVALYDKDGVLVKMDIANIPDYINPYSCNFKATLNMPENTDGSFATDGHKLKVYLWDTLDNISPYGQSIEF